MVIWWTSSWAAWRRMVMQTVLPLLFLSLVVGWLFDVPVAIHFKHGFGSLLHHYAAKLTDFGKADHFFAFFGAMLVISLATRKLRSENRANGPATRMLKWSVNGLAAMVVSGIFVQVIKHLVGRERPYADVELTSTHFSPMTTDYEWHSFPSGHSQVMFTVATIVAGRFPRAWIFCYAIASVFAATRVITLNHWASDTVAGAAVGILGATLALRLLAKSRATVFDSFD